jgi:hypothetical protein
MIPERWYVSGKVSIAGPVREFTAIDTEPSIPMRPMCSRTVFDNALMECERENRDCRSFLASDVPEANIKGVLSSCGSVILWN